MALLKWAWTEWRYAILSPQRKYSKNLATVFKWSLVPLKSVDSDNVEFDKSFRLSKNARLAEEEEERLNG